MKKSITSFTPSGGSLEKFTPEALRVALRRLSWKFLPSERTKLSLVESLRSITEVLIWGDQHNSEIFQVFIEENGLRRFLRLIQRRSNRRGSIAVQVLQSLAMLVQNIRNQRNLLRLLSSEAIGQVIELELDFSDEEVLCFFVSFLKSVTMRLDHTNVELFIKKIRRTEDRIMPLFSRASELLYNHESMVRKAMRTITLTLMSMKDDRINKFLMGQANRGFYHTLVQTTAEKIQEMRNLLHEDPERIQKRAEIEHLADDLTETIDYMNEMFTCASVEVQLQLANAVWDVLLDEQLTGSLYRVLTDPQQQQQFTCLDSTLCKDPSGVLKLPRQEDLRIIAEHWLPERVEVSIFTSLLLQTLNTLLLLSCSESSCCNRVLAQAINEAFHRLDETESERQNHLMKLDMNSKLFDTATDWQVDLTKDHLVRDSRLLAYAETLGLDKCLLVLKKLFQSTKVEKYKPSPLLVKLSKYPKTLISRRRRARRMSMPLILS
eukprot:g7720.t1